MKAERVRISEVVAGLLLGAVVAMSGLIWAKDSVKVALADGKGQAVGEAVVSKAASGVQIKLKLKNLSPGTHGVHVHQVAKCDGPDFKSAGPHFNPDKKQHGSDNPQGAHAGDLGNVEIGSKGTGSATITAAHLTLGDDDHSVFANGGTAIVIHAKADDMKTDPSGNSGDRIACGVITAPPMKK